MDKWLELLIWLATRPAAIIGLKPKPKVKVYLEWPEGRGVANIIIEVQ